MSIKLELIEKNEVLEDLMVPTNNKPGLSHQHGKVNNLPYNII